MDKIENKNLPKEEKINKGVAEINEMLKKEREQFGSNDIELSIENIEKEDDNVSDNESDIDEKEFTKLSIHNEKFVIILNKLFLVLISYGFLLLITVLFSGIFGHNVFPFQIQELSHWATQIGYVIFFASYWTSNMILLRVMTIVGYIFFTTSAFIGDTIPYMDVLSWTYIFCMINIQQIIRLLYDSRPIVFDPYREKIYTSMFNGIMKRSDFKTLTKNSLLRDLDNNRFYAKVGDRCSSLSILVYGRMRVYKSNEIIDENDPVDLYDNTSSQYEVYIDEDEFSLFDFFQCLRFVRGKLDFHSDYIRGRCMKMKVSIGPDGMGTLETWGRGKVALGWLDRLKGKKLLQLV